MTFKEYLYKSFPAKNSGTPASYHTAVELIDELIHLANLFNLGSQSIFELQDPFLIDNIIEFVVEEEFKFKRKESSAFDLINLMQRKQTSYPGGGFCSAAIKKYGEFIHLKYAQGVANFALSSNISASRISRLIQKQYKINDIGTEKEVRLKRRIGQDIFRAILLEIYSHKCCVTGIDVPDVLRASHIIPWSENKATRLNPENGLCLSATYDAAFDKHLISFDENYQMILSPILKEEFSSDAFKKYFLNFEGKKIELPSNYMPSQKFLEKHREKLII
ncbi:MAG: HNH endonuclease [Muribaculaceae bacterium]|nr:HNH endonuclease [Muribaculaceae bacterium]